MTPRERMDAATRPAQSLPDRVPVMCQLAIGSVPPRAPAENVMAISHAAKEQACAA